MPKIEHIVKEINTTSQAEFERQEIEMLKKMEDEGWQLTGVTNPMPGFGRYYFLKDKENPTPKEFK